MNLLVKVYSIFFLSYDQCDIFNLLENFFFFLCASSFTTHLLSILCFLINLINYTMCDVVITTTNYRTHDVVGSCTASSYEALRDNNVYLRSTRTPLFPPRHPQTETKAAHILLLTIQRPVNQNPSNNATALAHGGWYS